VEGSPILLVHLDLSVCVILVIPIKFLSTEKFLLFDGASQHEDILWKFASTTVFDLWEKYMSMQSWPRHFRKIIVPIFHENKDDSFIQRFVSSVYFLWHTAFLRLCLEVQMTYVFTTLSLYFLGWDQQGPTLCSSARATKLSKIVRIWQDPTPIIYCWSCDIDCWFLSEASRTSEGTSENIEIS